MSDKPSLYVVEKKEVVILVVLFVLVTVLSFTLGVRYGESVGKKLAREQDQAAREIGGENKPGGTGTLGKNDRHEEASGEKHEGGESKAEGEHGEAASEHGHGETKAGEHGHDESAAPAEAHGEAKEGHGGSHSPEEAAKSSSSGSVSREAVDKNSDEYLLNALKDAGVEPPGGKAPKDAKLPEEMKELAPRASMKAKSGSYVIQVGSHPTRSEAESQVKSLRGRRVAAEILPPFKDKQGEWHRVVIGGFKTKRDAEKEAGGLKGKGSIVSFFVWRLP